MSSYLYKPLFNPDAFRAPSAASVEKLREVPKKVGYFETVYSQMHSGVVACDEAMNKANIDKLAGITSAFLSMDAGEEKRLVVEKLEAIGTSFVAVGMGLELDERSLCFQYSGGRPECRNGSREMEKDPGVLSKPGTRTSLHLHHGWQHVVEW